MKRILTACLAFFMAGALGLFLTVLAQQPVKVVDSNGTAVPLATTTEVQHNVAFTPANMISLLLLCRASAAAPTAVGADDRGVLAWCNRDGSLNVTPQASAHGGADTCYRAATASTNAVNCKAQAATWYDYHAVNVTASLAYVTLYNNLGTPSCGTGIIEAIPIPASTTGAGIAFSLPVGRAFSTGIGICITANADGSGNAAAGTYVSLGVK